MAAMDVSELRKNAKIDIDGQPYVVVDFQFVKPGKGQGLYKCKIKNMITGSVLDRTWRSGEKFDPANVEQVPSLSSPDASDDVSSLPLPEPLSVSSPE